MRDRKLGRTSRAALVALLLAFASSTLADARTDFLIRMLSTSAQFRVRAQAALALGGSKPVDSAIVRALSTSLTDAHPAVRAASAAALERLRDPGSLPALRAAQSDSDGAVRAAVRSALTAIEPAGTRPQPVVPTPSGPATYYVGVGLPGSQAGLSSGALRSLREHVAEQVRQISGVRLAPENEDRGTAERVLGSQKLVGYFIDSSVTSVETRSDGSIRAQVSVIVGTYPGRDMRAMLSGAATLMGGGTDESAKIQAVQAAYAGALRRLPQAMQAGLARAQ